MLDYTHLVPVVLKVQMEAHNKLESLLWEPTWVEHPMMPISVGVPLDLVTNLRQDYKIKIKFSTIHHNFSDKKV